MGSDRPVVQQQNVQSLFLMQVSAVSAKAYKESLATWMISDSHTVYCPSIDASPCIHQAPRKGLALALAADCYFCLGGGPTPCVVAACS